MVLRPIISCLYGNPVSARSLNISASCIVKRLALANSQRPPGSYAERPLGQTAGVLRFHSSLEGLTDKGALCSGNSVSSFIQTRLPVAHRPAATLSNVKGKRDAPSLPANVTCLHSTQTNRSEPTMCVSGLPGAQSCKCSCEVTFSQPKHSFVAMVATCVYRELRPY